MKKNISALEYRLISSITGYRSFISEIYITEVWKDVFWHKTPACYQ